MAVSLFQTQSCSPAPSMGAQTSSEPHAVGLVTAQPRYELAHVKGGTVLVGFAGQLPPPDVYAGSNAVHLVPVFGSVVQLVPTVASVVPPPTSHVAVERITTLLAHVPAADAVPHVQLHVAGSATIPACEANSCRVADAGHAGATAPAAVTTTTGPFQPAGAA